MRLVVLEARHDHLHAGRLEQHDEVGQRTALADAELVAPEAGETGRVAAAGEVGVEPDHAGRGGPQLGSRRGDREPVARDFGEQRRLERSERGSGRLRSVVPRRGRGLAGDAAEDCGEAVPSSSASPRSTSAARRTSAARAGSSSIGAAARMSATSPMSA